MLCKWRTGYMWWTHKGHLAEAYLIVSGVMHWEGGVCIMGLKNTVQKFYNRRGGLLKTCASKAELCSCTRSDSHGRWRTAGPGGGEAEHKQAGVGCWKQLPGSQSYWDIPALLLAHAETTYPINPWVSQEEGEDLGVKPPWLLAARLEIRSFWNLDLTCF